MPSTADRRAPPASAVGLPRRQFLVGMTGVAGIPVLLGLAACSTGQPLPQPSGSSPTSAGPGVTAPTTEAPDVDAPALEAAAAEAMALLAAYEATVAVHPALGPVFAPYAIDHDTHLEALAERITLPAPSPTPSPTDSPTAGPPVPADSAAALAAVVKSEDATGETAREAARQAHDGEAARLLASIGASRAVHALLLGAPA